MRATEHFNALLVSLESAKTNFHVGDHVTWNSEAGRVSGVIQKVHTDDFQVNGYTHHASSEEPQYEIKSSKTDHVAYHKAGSLHHLSTSQENLADDPSTDVTTEALAEHSFKTLASGTKVSWPYRGTRGHGTVKGVHKLGKTAGDTAYTIEQHDHHVSKSGSKEKKHLIHYGRVLTVIH